MQAKIFTIPFDPENQVFHDETLNAFLGSRNVVRMRAEFFQHNGRPFWTVFTEVESKLPPAERKPGKTTLSELEQKRYDQLALWRRETAETLGVPVYVVATNRQLTEVALKIPNTIEALRQIPGFGKKKVDQHGKAIVELIERILDVETTAEKATNTPTAGDGEK